MPPVIANTFGGLPASYYFRHFIFMTAFPIFTFLIPSQGNHPLQIPMLLMTV